MEREVSIVVEISIVLVAISALLSIIFFTVYVGNDIKADATSSISDIKNEISVNYVKGLANGEIDNEMPSATAYNILTTYSDVIVESANGYDGEIRNLMTEDSDLKNKLTGRVQLELIEITDGAYVVFIHTGYDPNDPNNIAPGNCNWKNGNCTCPNKTGFYALKSKYNINTVW